MSKTEHKEFKKYISEKSAKNAIAILVKIIDSIQSFPQTVLPYDVSSVFFYREVGDGEERRGEEVR